MNRSLGESGFSLIEVLVAVTIFAAGLLAVASMQLSSVTGNFSARTATESTALVQEKVETFFTLPYTHDDLISDLDGDGAIEVELAGDTDGDGTIEDDDVHEQSVSGVDGNYLYRWIVEDDAALTNTKTITLEVEYGQARNKRTRIVFAKADII